jgi:hypothetical protein
MHLPVCLLWVEFDFVYPNLSQVMTVWRFFPSVWNLHPLDGLQVFSLGPRQAPYPAGDRSVPPSLAPTLHHSSGGLMEDHSRQFNENALVI